MDFLVKDFRPGGPFIITACMKRCNDGLAEREQTKAQMRLALERQWRNRVKQLSPTALQYSFSHLDGQTWAVSISRLWRVGIDAACNAEFSSPYPLQKVFHPQELFSMESAQVWSAKEAVAKALSCGFDGVNPIDIRVVNAGSAVVANRVFGMDFPVPFQLWSQCPGNGVWVTVAYQRKGESFAVD